MTRDFEQVGRPAVAEDRAAAQHDDGAADGADGRGGHAVDERDDARPLAVFLEVRRGNDCEQVAGQERGDGRDARAREARQPGSR